MERTTDVGAVLAILNVRTRDAVRFGRAKVGASNTSRLVVFTDEGRIEGETDCGISTKRGMAIIPQVQADVRVPGEYSD